MSKKKLITAVASMALLANLAIAGSAMAATSTASLTVDAGTLSIALASSTVNLGTITASTSDQTTSAVNFPEIDFSDHTGTNNGFTLTAETTPLTDGGSNTIPYTNIEIQADGGHAVNALNGSDSTGLVVSSAGSYMGFSGSGADSDSKTLVTADTSRVRIDDFDIQPTLQVQVPARQAPAAYSATVTIGIQ